MPTSVLYFLRTRLARASMRPLTVTYLLLGALLGQFVQPLQPVAYAARTTITIDGNGADWTGVPQFTDPNTDAGGGSGDITALRITNDATNVYVRWDEVLTANRNQVASDGFAVAVNTSGGTTPNAIGWVTFDSQGRATTSVERPVGGTSTQVGSAKQSCDYQACANGAAVFVEAAFPLAAFGASASQVIGIDGETLASDSVTSRVKDCIPGGATCAGMFSLDLAAGAVTINGGDTSATSVTCASNPAVINVAVTCTATVTDSTTPANVPTGTVTWSTSGGGSFGASTCTLSSGSCQVSFTPSASGTFTVTGTYGGNTGATVYKASSGTASLVVNAAAATSTPTATATATATNTATATATATSTTVATATPTATASATASVSGSIADARTGQPISGATVIAGSAWVTTDASGAYLLSGLPANTSVTIYATHPDYATTASSSTSVTLAPSATQVVNLQLEPKPGTITGTVTDQATGSPIAGATVQVVDGSNAPLATTTTNALGQYALGSLLEGALTLNVSAAGYVGTSTNVTVRPNASTTANQALAAAAQSASESGAVTDALTGQPIRGASVSLSQAGTSVTTTTTDANGHYTISNATAGVPATVSASAANYTATAASTATFTPSALVGSAENLQLQPLPGSIGGTLSDQTSGTRLGGATVQVRDTSGAVVASATTDATGRYTLAGLAEGTYTVSFAAPTYTDRSVACAVAPNAATSLDQALAPQPGTIAGVVTDAATGQPVADATVSVGGVSTTTDASGQYVLASLAAGAPVTVSVSDPDYVAIAASSATLAPAAGASATANLQLQPKPGAISGTLTDQTTASPIGGVTVQVTDATLVVVATTTTSLAGQYTITGLVEGGFTVRFSAAGYQPASATASVRPNASTALDQVLTPTPSALPGSVSGVVTDSLNGQPVSGAIVSLTQGATTVTTATTSNGQYTFGTLMPGLLATVSASHPNYATTAAGSASFTPSSAAASAEDLHLQPLPGSLDGSLTDQVTGMPLAGATVQVTDASGGPVASATTDASGRYSLAGLAEGSYTLSFSAPGYASGTATAAVGPNATTTVALALAPQAGSISGLVSDAATGLPIAGATVSVGAASATTDGAGRYTLGGMPAGTAVTVSATHPDYTATAASSATLTLAAGASGTASLQLQPKPASLDGVITDQASGAALSGVSVQAEDAQGAVLASAATGADGHYHLMGLTPGSLAVAFAASGYASATAPVVLAPNAAGTANQALVANPIGTTLTLALAAGSAEPSSADHALTLVAQVVPNSPTAAGPSGTVTFTDGTTTVGTSALDASGNATLTLSGFAPGTYAFTATYAGDARFAASTSPALEHHVQAVQTARSTGSGGSSPHRTTAASTTAQSGGADIPNAAGGSAGPAVVPVGPAVAPVAPGVAVDTPAPGSSAPRALVVAPPPAPASGASTPDAGDPASAQDPLHLRAALADAETGAVVGQIVVEPTNPDFAAGLPDGIRVDVIGSTNVERHLVSDPDQGALGGGNAARIAPPVDLNLVAHSVVSGEEILLPDGVRAQTFRVSLPVLARPTNPDETFTWLAAVQQDGQPAGYMRYPSTYDPDTDMLVYEMPATVLESTAVLPVILQPAWVQAFLPEVHVWSSPFHAGQDLGVSGELWTTYRVVAPQVADRIGIVHPETGEMVWIDAYGVGPTEDPEASNL